MASTTLAQKARSYRGEEDLAALADLINLCAEAEEDDEGTSASQLRHAFNEPSFNQQEDLRFWEDEQGKLIGYAEIWSTESGTELDADLDFTIHPIAKNSDLGQQIIHWGRKRIQEIATAKASKVVKLFCASSNQKAKRIALLKDNGFVPARYFFRMERSLRKSIREPQFPQGFKLQQVKPGRDDQAWVEMFNQTFIDHWNHHDMTVEQYQFYLKNPHFRPELHLVGVAPDGTFAAFCHCFINPEDNARNNTNEGWINALGTRRGFRNQGLGRAMLLSGLHKLKAAGMETAKLGVDADNPSGALGLYESAGFTQKRTNIVYVEEIEQ